MAYIDTVPSSSQSRMVFADAVQRTAGYVKLRLQYALMFQFFSAPDRVALQKTLDAIVARHSALRTAFCRRDACSETEWKLRLAHFAFVGIADTDAVSARIWREASTSIEYIELPSVSEDCKGFGGTLWAEASRQLAVPLSLDTVPLIRASVVQVGEAWFLILVVSRLSIDGYSIRILQRELNAFYAAYEQGYDVKAEPLPVQYSTILEWQRAHKGSDKWMMADLFWRSRLDELDTASCGRMGALLSVSDVFEPGETTICRHVLSETDGARVRMAARRIGVTMSVLLRSALVAVIYRSVGAKKFPLFAHFANRNSPGAEQVVGPLSTSHIVSIQVEQAQSFADICATVAMSLYQADAYAFVSSSEVGDRSSAENCWPKLKVSCDSWPRAGIAGNHLIQALRSPVSVSWMDLDLRVDSSGTDVGLVALFPSGRFDSECVCALLDRIARVMVASGEDVGAGIL